MKITRQVNVGFDPHGADPKRITDPAGKVIEISPLESQVAALATVSREFANYPVTFKVPGHEDEIRAELAKHEHADNIQIFQVDDIFAMGGKVNDYRGKTTTISWLAKMQKAGEVDVVFSNGNTIATVYYPSHPRHGVGFLGHGIRPAIVTTMPRSLRDFYFLIDAGANKKARAQQLFYNALFTQLYLQHVNGIQSPRVGLLEGPLAEEAEALFEKGIERYVGIVQPSDVYRNAVDLLVTDGFNGNIYLKASETGANGTKARFERANRWQKAVARFAPVFSGLLMPYFGPGEWRRLRTLAGHTYALLPVEGINEENLLARIKKLQPRDGGLNITVLSNGEEDVKGNQFAQELAAALRAAASRGGFNYKGFVEPDDIVHGVAERGDKSYRIDAVFTQTKTAELFSDTITASENVFLELVRPLFRMPPDKAREKFKELKEVMNPNKYNGAPAIGVNGYVVVGHGKADQFGTEQGLRFAIEYFLSGFVEHARNYMKERAPILHS